MVGRKRKMTGARRLTPMTTVIRAATTAKKKRTKFARTAVTINYKSNINENQTMRETTSIAITTTATATAFTKTSSSTTTTTLTAQQKKQKNKTKTKQKRKKNKTTNKQQQQLCVLSTPLVSPMSPPPYLLLRLA